MIVTFTNLVWNLAVISLSLIGSYWVSDFSASFNITTATPSFTVWIIISTRVEYMHLFFLNKDFISPSPSDFANSKDV